MPNPKHRVATADIEAAAWHARLGARSVSTETLEAYFAWRAAPANAEAYRRVEKAWAETGKLAGRPGIEAAVTAAEGRREHRAAAPAIGRGAWAAIAGVCVAAVLAVGGWSWLQGRTVFATDVGEQRVVQLADGSSVRLDTQSRIRVRYGSEGRRVDLVRGQAQFAVAHDAARPFVVFAGDARVTAIGTVFDVRHEGPAVRVTLISGVVDVARPAAAQQTRLEAGRQATLKAGSLQVRPVDVVEEASWTEGRIVFHDTPLAQAVAEVNRYLTDEIVLTPGPSDGVAINGVFKVGDRDAFVSAASGALDLTATPQADGRLVLAAQKKN